MAKRRMFKRLARTSSLLGESLNGMTLGFSGPSTRRETMGRRSYD